MTRADVQGRRFEKTTDEGAAFFVTLHADGSLTEGRQDDGESWSGTWWITGIRTSDVYQREAADQGALAMQIGEYLAVLFPDSSGTFFAGPEHFQKAYRPHAYLRLALQPEESQEDLSPAGPLTESLEDFVRSVLKAAGESIDAADDASIRLVAQALDVDLRLTMIAQLPEAVRPRLAHLLLDPDVWPLAWRTIVEEYIPTESSVMQNRLAELKDMINFGLTDDPMVIQVLVSRATTAHDAFSYETFGRGNHHWKTGGPLEESLRDAFLAWLSTKAVVSASQVAGRTFMKVTTNGDGFLLTLNPDGSVLERPAADPADSWGGEWEIAFDATGEDPARGLVVVSIGEYAALLFHSAVEDSLAGPEHFKEADRPHGFVWLAPVGTPVRSWLSGKLDEAVVASLEAAFS